MPLPPPIYLDYHATTPVDRRVAADMLPWLGERFGNAASVGHVAGRAAADVVAAARGMIAAALGCEPEEIIFTSGATEANNLALKGTLQAAGRGAHLVTNAAEHRSVLDPARRLRREGCPVTIVPVDAHGRVDPERIAHALQPSTRLVSVMLANNEVGTLNPLHEIGELCRAGVLLHCDAAQGVGKVPLDLSITPIDLLTFTAHKLCGPQGIGALYVRRRDPVVPLLAQIDGGGHERGLRSGTLPVALIAGFGAAAQIAVAERVAEGKRVGDLRDRLRTLLAASLDGLTFHGHPRDRLPGNLNVGFDGVDGDALLIGVAERGLCVSSGSACTSADPEPSHVLRAMGVADALARSSLRFGLGRFTTAEDVVAAAEIVVEVVRSLRGEKRATSEDAAKR